MIAQPLATNKPKAAKSRRRLLREAYHGKVLRSIARQCPIRKPDADGFFPEAIACAAWKEKFRELFHPGRSSEDLSDDELALVMVQAEAWAAMELGVTFEESASRAH